MAAINGMNGIQGLSRAYQNPGLNPSKTQRADDAKAPGFSDVLKAYVDNVDGQQKHAASAMKDLVAGKTTDILPVVNATAKADLSFKMLLGVRNKMIDAYKETMRMQV